MNEINEIVLSLAEYKNLDTLYSKVGEHVKLLLEAGNVVTVFPSGNKLTEIIIQFTTLDDKSPKPYWLFDDEASYVSKYHLAKELDIW